MAPPKLLTDPRTGESISQTEMARRLGINDSTLSDRLKKMPLEKALMPGRMTKASNRWSPEEDDYLIDVYRAPNLYELWNKTAKKRGWKLRGEKAIENRIFILQQKRLIGDRRSIDEADGWLLITHLAGHIGVQSSTIQSWIKRHGLIAHKDGDVHTKIHLWEFTNWATSVVGAAVVGKAIASNQLAITWLLVQIGNWAKEKKPRGLLSKVKGKGDDNAD